ncbi:MAG: hypothetical protein HN337_02685 [Deltaproteobacteria bacterium]|nr:hypothetical protein [Deltaproteobacteria bacterium]
MSAQVLRTTNFGSRFSQFLAQQAMVPTVPASLTSEPSLTYKYAEALQMTGTPAAAEAAMPVAVAPPVEALIALPFKQFSEDQQGLLSSVVQMHSRGKPEQSPAFVVNARYPLNRFVDQLVAISLPMNELVEWSDKLPAEQLRTLHTRFRPQKSDDFFEIGMKKFMLAATSRFGLEASTTVLEEVIAKKVAHRFEESAKFFMKMRYFGAAAMAFEMAAIEADTLKPQRGSDLERQVRSWRGEAAHSWLQSLSSDDDHITYTLRLQRALYFGWNAATPDDYLHILGLSTRANSINGNHDETANDLLRTALYRLQHAQRVDSAIWQHVATSIGGAIKIWDDYGIAERKPRELTQIFATAANRFSSEG